MGEGIRPLPLLLKYGSDACFLVRYSGELVSLPAKRRFGGLRLLPDMCIQGGNEAGAAFIWTMQVYPLTLSTFEQVDDLR